jgi:hypothetical protein
MIELREYKVKVDRLGEYMKETIAAGELRKALVPLKLFALPDTGGLLNAPSHFYCYKDNVERDQMRKKMAQNEEWIAYLNKVKPCMHEQKSTLYFEADLDKSMMTSLSTDALARPDGTDPIYEYRRYQLGLGYGTVPKFLEIYKHGLQSKLQNIHSSTELVSLMYSDVGQINEVIEIWRHGDGFEAMNDSRIMARGAAQWTEAVQALVPLAATFTNSISKPASFSPFR